MINLIPQVVRKAVITEYWVRAVTVWLFIIAVVSVAIIFAILPLYVLVTSQVDVYASDAAKANKRVAEYDFSAGELVRANGMAQKIFELRDLEQFSGVIALFESLRNPEITLDGFELGRKEEELMPVQVTGKATTRQALADFRDTLLAQKNVAEVLLPISNLAKDKDIQFSISVTLKTES